MLKSIIMAFVCKLPGAFSRAFVREIM